MLTWWTRQTPIQRAAIFFLIAFLAATAAAMVFVRVNIHLIKSNVQSKNLDLATGYAHDVDDFISRTEDILRTLVEFQIHEKGQVEDILPDFKAHFPEYENFFLTDASGRISTSVPHTTDIFIDDRPYFRQAMETGRLAVSDGIISRIDGELIVVIALPIVVRPGKPSGIVGATVHLDHLPWLFSEVQAGRQGFVTILDSQGYPLLHRNPDYVRKRPNFSGIPAVAQALSGEPAAGESEDPLDGDLALVSFAPTRRAGWVVGLEEPVPQAYDLIKEVLWRALVTLAIFAGPFLAAMAILVGDLKISNSRLRAVADQLREEQQQLVQANLRLELAATTDTLTGLPNYRAFHDELERALAKARKEGQPVSVFLMDLDGAKKYNELFGYHAGDNLLKDLGTVLRESVSNGQVVARYEGDMFGFIMFGADSDQAVETAEQICSIVENYPFPGREELPGGKMSVSVGLASFPRHATTKDELVRMAGEALHKVKHLHHRRVEVYYSVLDELKSHLNESEIVLMTTIKTLLTVINAKDQYTFGHTERVVTYSTALAREIGLSEDQIHRVALGAFLHDIGKIEVPREVLCKAGPLSLEELFQMRQHPRWGVDIIRPVGALRSVTPMVLHHHERYDGRGYPDGLVGEEIPLEARIITICDTFDAITTQRPYKPARSYRQAVQELRDCSGTQFDPVLVEAFAALVEQHPEKLGLMPMESAS